MGQHKRNPLHSAYSFNHHLQHTSHNKGFQEIASGAKAPLLNTLYHKPNNMKNYLSDISFIILTVMYIISADFKHLTTTNYVAFILIIVWAITFVIKLWRKH